MTDDELIEKMWLEWAEHATPKPFDLKSAMRAVLAVVREHDGRDAERWRTLQRMRTEEVLRGLEENKTAHRYSGPVPYGLTERVDAAIARGKE